MPEELQHLEKHEGALALVNMTGRSKGEPLISLLPPAHIHWRGLPPPHAHKYVPEALHAGFNLLPGGRPPSGGEASRIGARLEQGHAVALLAQVLGSTKT